MIDVMNDGSAIMSEMPMDCSCIRVTAFPPPFVPQTLLKQSLFRYAVELCKNYSVPQCFLKSIGLPPHVVQIPSL